LVGHPETGDNKSAVNEWLLLMRFTKYMKTTYIEGEISCIRKQLFQTHNVACSNYFTLTFGGTDCFFLSLSNAEVQAPVNPESM
jgi:hypothetical protein